MFQSQNLSTSKSILNIIQNRQIGKFELEGTMNMEMLVMFIIIIYYIHMLPINHIMLYLIFGIILLYSTISYIRRKTVKPNYKDKIVWITGASSGIGQFLAYQFNKCGAHVILSARNIKELNRVKNACPNPENAEVVPMDMVEYDNVRQTTEDLISRLESQNKKIDVVVQNAGASMRCQFLNYSFENHKSLLDVNVNGPFNHLQAVVPHFIKNKSGQIVGITSLAGKLSLANRSSYAGSKHAFIGILDSLRLELKPYGIKVCNIMPGYIKTNISKNAFAGKAGQKFGQTDANIGTGMNPALFARDAVGSIYNNENQVQISKDWLPMLGMGLRNICPDLFFKMSFRFAKKQSSASNVKKE